MLKLTTGLYTMAHQHGQHIFPERHVHGPLRWFRLPWPRNAFFSLCNKIARLCLSGNQTFLLQHPVGFLYGGNANAVLTGKLTNRRQFIAWCKVAHLNVFF